MNSLKRSNTDKDQIEELAMRFASKSPNETTFNNNKSKKYFDSKVSGRRKESLSSKDTVKMSYHSGRRSNLSIINSEFSQGINPLTRNGSLKTENDKELINLHNFYIVCCEKLSSKKEAVKLDQKLIGEDQEIICLDEIIDEDEEASVSMEGMNTTGVVKDKVFEEEIKENLDFIKQVSSKTTCENVSSLSANNEEALKMVEQRTEILLQIDNFYNSVKKQVDEKNSQELNKLIDYWFQIILGTLDLMINDRFLYKEILFESQFLTQIVTEMILFAIVFQRDLGKEHVMNGLKNSVFYIQQNYCTYMSVASEKHTNFDFLDKVLGLKRRVSENKSWLSNKQPKKLVNNNNQININIISNMISLIKANDENSVDDESNLDIALNYLSQFNINCGDQKESVYSLREFLYSNFLQKTVAKVSLHEPFLPPISDQRKYTLVLDLDETLVHYVEEDDSAYILVRPGAEKFIEETSKYFELVIFTAATQDYADFVLNELDKNNKITHRLYRQHTTQMEGCNNVKDLSKIGRDLTRTCILDNVKENFQLQKDNGLHIKDFIDDVNDSELPNILPDLVKIACSGTNDIRKMLDSIRWKLSVGTGSKSVFEKEEDKKEI